MTMRISIVRALKQIGHKDSALALGFDPLGRKTYVSRAGAAISAYAYDIAGRLSSILNTNGAGTVISSLTYAYDNAGTRTAQVEADGTLTTWTYDATNQLTRDQRSGDDGFDISYAYDNAGNRVVKTEVPIGGGSNVITTSVYDNANRIQTATTGVAITTYTHDAAGNRTQVNHPDTTIDYYTWDARSLMVLADAGGNVVTNTFNAPGQRVGKETSGGTTHFRYDGQNLI